MLAGITASRKRMAISGWLPVNGTGGTITDVGSYRYHTFTADGTFTATNAGTIEYLVVAGGGAGGDSTSASYRGGGGGAGGYQSSSASITATSFPVVVGAATTSFVSGNDSSFNGITSTGGGRGGNNYGQNETGGSGGGGGNANAFSTGIVGQGNDGGKGNTDGGGGGGGAGTVGQDGVEVAGRGGDGGAGTQWLDGNFYAGGGGGSAYQYTVGWGGQGGSGIGGNGGAGGVSATSGAAGTGSGGGGADTNGGQAGNGASGVVIIRYSLIELPNPPDNLLVIPGSTDNELDLSWTATTGNVAASGYNIYRDGVFLIDVGNVLTYTDGGLMAGTDYSYTISAYDSSGNEGVQSSAVIGTTSGTFGYNYFRFNCTKMSGTSLGERIYQFDFYSGGTSGTQVIQKNVSSAVSASSFYNSATYDATQAADNDLASSWIAELTPSVSVPQWWQANMVSPVSVDTYRFYTIDSTRSPVDWTFEGSTDGTNWDILHTVTGHVYVSGYNTFTI